MASVKGFIWYSPSQFKEWGVEVPTTWQELLDLTKTIQQKTGKAPWCAGFGSDAATGWPGTDWVEDLVLRQAGPDVYDQWVKHEIPFNDPQIKKAFDAVGEILLNPDYVNAGFGDVKSINTTPFGDPARALGDGIVRTAPPGVVLRRLHPGPGQRQRHCRTGCRHLGLHHPG